MPLSEIVLVVSALLGLFQVGLLVLQLFLQATVALGLGRELGVQVHGGMGYIEETGAAVFYRDARIAQIYEGTNGIQAMDLLGRRLGMNNGKPIMDLMGEIQELELE